MNDVVAQYTSHLMEGVLHLVYMQRIISLPTCMDIQINHRYLLISTYLNLILQHISSHFFSRISIKRLFLYFVFCKQKTFSRDFTKTNWARDCYSENQHRMIWRKVCSLNWKRWIRDEIFHRFRSDFCVFVLADLSTRNYR